jgi:hypothetical protein
MAVANDAWQSHCFTYDCLAQLLAGQPVKAQPKPSHNGRLGPCSDLNDIDCGFLCAGRVALNNLAWIKIYSA